MRRLEAEGRPADPTEQATLARWAGWGAVPQVFDDGESRFAHVRAGLRELLSPDEFAAASRNTLNAHYTDASLVRTVWDAVVALGFEAGTVLKPGCGSGAFIGFAPPSARMVGVELDPTTAAMARALYPNAQILTESFANTRAPEASFDATVGNVPFGRIALHDPHFNGWGHSIHNHFLVKALALTRPGGIVALLTSRYTLDARNPAARREFAELGDLIGAVRLPEGAHRRAAGTEVVTDLVLFRRRSPGDPPRGADFEQVVRVELEGGSAELNRYFVEHPDHVLGELYVGRGMYGLEELLVRGDPDAAPGLSRALGHVVRHAKEEGLQFFPAPQRQLAEPLALVGRGEGRPHGYLDATAGSRFTQVVAGQVVAYEVPRSQQRELRSLLGLRDFMVALLEAEAASRDDTPQIAGLRPELNRRYDAYVASYGPINRFSWRRTGG